MEHVDRLAQLVAWMRGWLAQLDAEDVGFFVLLGMLVGIGVYLRRLSRKQ
jgi:hypothetical protein